MPLKKHPGRPRAGMRPGERVRDYRNLGVRMPDCTRARLKGLAAIRGVPSWRLVTDLVETAAHELGKR